jgi:integrase
MLRIYRIGALHQLVKNNPVLPVETRSTTDYKAILVTPKQTWEIIESLANPLHRILILTCAATALRASELLALRWTDVLWEDNRIAVTKRWWRGSDGPTKTRRSEGHVPMHPALAQFLRAWRDKTPFAEDTDFVSVAQDGWSCSHLPRGIRRRPSAARCQSSRASDTRRLPLRVAQSPALAFKLAGEQREGRAEDGPKPAAAQPHPDHAGPLHTRRWR